MWSEVISHNQGSSQTVWALNEVAVTRTIIKHLDTLALSFLGETMDYGMKTWDKPTVETHQCSEA